MNRPDGSLAAYPSKRYEVPVLDDTDDRLVVRLLRPKGTDIDAAPAGPVVVLLHGLAGHADSVYMRKTALHLLGNGRDVMLFNFRGAGDSDATCSRHHNPGRSDDIKALFRHDFHRDGPDLFAHGAVCVGFSLGGNVLVKYLGEANDPVAVRAAVCVSAPLELEHTSRRLGRVRNMPYRLYLLGKLRYRLRTDPDGLSQSASRRIFWSTSIYKFDKRFTAPRNGYDSVEAYYADNSCANDLPRVRVPTYLFHADDDPFVPASLYRDYDWSKNPRLVPLLTSHGGHVGFTQRDGTLWHNQCLTHLLDKLTP